MSGPARGRALALLGLAAAVAATFSDALFGPRVFFQRDIDGASVAQFTDGHTQSP